MSDHFLNPSQAARRLGVSAKALRLYEQRGLVSPLRTEAGWRVYGPDQMARCGEIAGLRSLGFSLSQVGRVLAGDPAGLEPALAVHQAALEGRLGALSATVDQVRRLRAQLGDGKAPSVADLTRLGTPPGGLSVAFDLPWPWGGEPFAFSNIPGLTWLIGPLGSGKTRLAMRLAEALPGAAFIGLDRGPDTDQRLQADPALRARVAQAIAWLVDEGAQASQALTALLVHLLDDGPTALVFDLIEQGLDASTQEALSNWLRRHARAERPVIAMTRSTAMLDLAAVVTGEALLFCPANHSPPVRVAPWPGSPGYESVETCLAAPEVRARTEGMSATLLRVA